MTQLEIEHIEWILDRPLEDDEIQRIDELWSGKKMYSMEELINNYTDLLQHQISNRKLVRIPPSHLGLRPRPYRN